jgi:hypothetical protein
MVTSLTLILFFSYGQFYAFFEKNPLLGLVFSRHRYLIPLWSVLFLIGLWIIIKKVRDVGLFTWTLNLIGIILLVFPVSQTAIFFIRSQRAAQVRVQQNSGSTILSAADPQKMPDIYLIILDMYARDDVLLSDYGYDSTSFLNNMRSKGFFVVDCSLSNYSHTELSMTSELNFDYIQNLGDQFKLPSTDRSAMWPYIQHSAVRNLLESIGYKTVAFETGYPWSQLEDAAYYFTPPTRSLILSQINPFEAMLVNSSAGLILSDAQLLLSGNLNAKANFLHANRELFVLKKLEEVPLIEGPKFVFAHILVPHQPFVFDPQGNIVADPNFYSEGWGLPVNDTYASTGYINQVAFLDNRLPSLIDKILKESRVPPVILIESDHGTDVDRDANLEAFYLPGGGNNQLYQGMTLVNTFRIVFNQYFSAHLALLPDKSYIGNYNDPYNFSNFVDNSPACQKK